MNTTHRDNKQLCKEFKKLRRDPQHKASVKIAEGAISRTIKKSQKIQTQTQQDWLAHQRQTERRMGHYITKVAGWVKARQKAVVPAGETWTATQIAQFAIDYARQHQDWYDRDNTK